MYKWIEEKYKHGCVYHDNGDVVLINNCTSNGCLLEQIYLLPNAVLVSW